MGGFRARVGAGLAAVLAVSALGVGAALAGGGEDCPPNPEPGKCYEKVLVPEQYETFEEQVLDRPGRTERRVIPAVYREDLRQELVCAEHEETVTIPATYRTVAERVLVREAHMEWRRGVLIGDRPTRDGYTRVTPTGEVLCYVLVPAEYRVVTRQVIDRPERVERRVVPARYRSVRVPVLVTPERVETYEVPASYRTVLSRRRVREASFEWRVIRCADGSEATLPGYSPRPAAYGGAPEGRVLTSPAVVRAVQAALARQGYYRGPSNGFATADTEWGLARFQADRRLAPGWTPETLRALGVPYPD